MSARAWIAVNLSEASPTQRMLKRFIQLSLEMERHCRGQHFGDAMLTFPSAKFHEWCELGKLLDSKEGEMAGTDVRSLMGGQGLPQYQSHKKVWALKIASLEFLANGQLGITPADTRYDPFVVPGKFVPKHQEGRPAVGWYWVRYLDGYESFSPPEPFEEGYTRI